MAERENRTTPLSLTGDSLLLLCALMGFTGSFLTLYTGHDLGSSPLEACAAQWGGHLLLLAGLFGLLALAAWSLPRFRWVSAGGLALILAAAAALNWEAAVQGAGVTVHTVTAIFSLRVSWGQVFQYQPDLSFSGMASATQLFLILALALLALALGWAVVRAKRWWLVALFTLPPLLPGLLADLYPSWPPFITLCACWCSMLLTDLCKWAAPSGRGKLTLTALGCTAAVLAIVSAAFPQEGYTRPQWARDWENELYNSTSRFADFFSQWDGPFQSRVTYVGAAEEADLTGAGPLNYSGRTVLRVSTDYSGRLYLRGSSLACYEDGVWTALPEGAYEEDYLDTLHTDAGDAPSPLLFPTRQNRQGQGYTLTVENVGAVGSCVYTPYYLNDQEWAELGMLPVEDAYFARLQGQRSFTMTFFDAWPQGLAPTQSERAYLGLVHHNYLDVPEELQGPLLELCQQNGLYLADTDGQDIILGHGTAIYAVMDPIEAARRAAAILDGLCEYDPQAPAPPEGTDPVEYFLFDSQRGYCMHYASAAALMLRSLGIPARYVSGFTADCTPGQQVNVPDRAAHAWVEVYLSGFGWYPVEVTPAAAFEWYEHGDAEPSAEPSGDPEESETPEPTPTPEPGATEAPSAEPSQEIAGPADGPDLTALFQILKALAAIAGGAVLLWLGQRLPKRFRAKKLASPDRNRAALDGYSYLLRMERWGGRVDERAVELAEKARFSQHTLTEAELTELTALIDLERERLCLILSPGARLAFRYLWGMPVRPKIGENTENSWENGD